MVKILISFEVSDFAKWKAGFDGNAGGRKDAGVVNASIYRGVEKPNSIQVLVEAEDEKKGMMFFTSGELREVQVKSGVLGKPGVYRLEML
jgi:hypothetical protein